MIWLAAPALAGAAYYVLAIVGAAKWRRATAPLAASPTSPAGLLPISILKPVRGKDPHFFEAIRSHAGQDYPEFEILFGVIDAADPAIPDIRRLQAEFPERAISLHVVPTTAPNAKAGVLAELSRRARHPLLLVNDSDIQVPSGYLRAVVGALGAPRTGIVTCLYRARADSWPARWEALGIATEFIPSLVVARLLGVAEFACGSTLALRAEVLREIGGSCSLWPCRK